MRRQGSTRIGMQNLNKWPLILAVFISELVSMIENMEARRGCMYDRPEKVTPGADR